MSSEQFSPVWVYNNDQLSFNYDMHFERTLTFKDTQDVYVLIQSKSATAPLPWHHPAYSSMNGIIFLILFICLQERKEFIIIKIL